MEKSTINDLKKKILIRAYLISLDSLEELLDMNDYLSPDEILGELIKKSLRDFEYHYPLVTEFRVTKDSMCCCKRGDGWMELKNNFHLFLKCAIAEDQIILIPNATPKLRIASQSLYSSSYPYPGSYSLPIAYERPFLYLGDTWGTMFYMHGIYSRPIDIRFTPDKKFTPESAIYWMNIEEGVLGQKFIDQCLVNILDMVRNQKANLSLPNMPVDFMAGVDTAYMNLKQELDQFYLQSSWRGDLLV